MPVDYKKYPPNWKTEIVPAVLTRANNCCEECSRENGSLCVSIPELPGSKKRIWVNDFLADHPAGKKVRVILTVAHLDHDEGNHNVSLDRLKAMCQLCHLRYDAQEKKRRKQLKNETTNQKLAL